MIKTGFKNSVPRATHDARAHLDKALPDLSEVATWLHGDDSQMVFLVHPDQETFVVAEEDTAT